MDKKVAILISGQVRRSSYDVMPSLNRNLIEPNNADVFLSSWNIMPSENQRIAEQNRNPNFVSVDTNALNIRNLKGIDLEAQKKVTDICKVHHSRLFDDPHPPHGICYNAYLLKKAMRMIEEAERVDGEYDYILKIRPDFYAGRINISEADILTFSQNASNSFMLSDKLFWGTRNQMKFFIDCLDLHQHKILTLPYDKSLSKDLQPIGERFQMQIVKFYGIDYKVSREGIPHCNVKSAKEMGLL